MKCSSKADEYNKQVHGIEKKDFSELVERLVILKQVEDHPLIPGERRTENRTCGDGPGLLSPAEAIEDSQYLMKDDGENENHEDHGGPDFDDCDFRFCTMVLQLFQSHRCLFQIGPSSCRP